MKFYIFASEPVKSASDLPSAKDKARTTLDSLRVLIEADAAGRAV